MELHEAHPRPVQIEILRFTTHSVPPTLTLQRPSPPLSFIDIHHYLCTPTKSFINHPSIIHPYNSDLVALLRCGGFTSDIHFEMYTNSSTMSRALEEYTETFKLTLGILCNKHLSR